MGKSRKRKKPQQLTRLEKVKLDLGRIPLPEKTEMTHRDKSAFSRKNKVGQKEKHNLKNMTRGHQE